MYNLHILHPFSSHTHVAESFAKIIKRNWFMSITRRINVGQEQDNPETSLNFYFIHSN